MKYKSRYSILLDVQILLAFKLSMFNNSQMAVTVEYLLQPLLHVLFMVYTLKHCNLISPKMRNHLYQSLKSGVLKNVSYILDCVRYIFS